MIPPVLQLLLLALLFVLLLRLTTARWLRMLLAVFFALVLTTEAVCLYLTGSFFNYQAWVHTNFEAVRSMGSLLIKQGSAAILTCAALAFVLYKLGAAKPPRRKAFPLLACLFIAFLLTPRIAGDGGIVGELHQIYKIKFVGNQSFTAALQDLGIDPQTYPTGDQITAQAGKNIIVILAESLEGTYFTHFPGLLPNLEKLSKDWTYYNDILYSPGTGWTAASLYAYQAGMPGWHDNDLFRHASESRITGLGTVLAAAGYDMKALMKVKDLAGKDGILTAYGIETIDASNSIGQYKDFYDLDLFQEARLQIERLTQSPRPFALFLTTFNTHFPNGIYDARMKQFIDREDDGMEFAAASVDYLIGDFIQYLQDRGLLENTILYLFPDHLLTAVGSHPYDVFVRAEHRNMYMITNAPAEKFSKPPSQSIHPIELPRMILQGADVRSNAKFLVDFIPETEDINAFLTQNQEKLTALNSAAVHRESYQDGFKVSFENGQLTVQALQGDLKETVETGSIQSALYDFRFNENMVFLGWQKFLNKPAALEADEKTRQHDNLHLLIAFTDGKISELYFGNKRNLGSLRTGDELTFDKAAVQEIQHSLRLLARLDDPARKQASRGPVQIISAAWEEAQNGNPTRILIHNQYLPLPPNSRGINLLSRDTQGAYHVENFDWFENTAPAHALLARMRALQQCRQPFILIGDDAIIRHPAELDEEFVRMGLYKLVPINGRAAYLAYSNAQGVVTGERTARDTVSIDITDLPLALPCPHRPS